MAHTGTFNEILDDVRQLVVQNAHAAKKTLELSPEVAAFFLQTAGKTPPEDNSAPPDEIAAETPRTEESAPAVETTPATGTADTWSAIETEVAGCTRCPLHETRTHTVFGAGDRQADLVFVGEAPGQEEDRRGEPFVGAAGQMLTDIIVKGMKMSREDVFICNVLKCRPPGNRNPGPEEVYHCEPYLVRQLALLRPKVICALGGVAAQTLLKTDTSVGKLRGAWHRYEGIPLRVTYHPSYLIRQKNPERLRAEKGKVWQDVQAILRLLAGEETP